MKLIFCKRLVMVLCVTVLSVVFFVGCNKPPITTAQQWDEAFDSVLNNFYSPERNLQIKSDTTITSTDGIFDISLNSHSLTQINKDESLIFFEKTSFGETEVSDSYVKIDGYDVIIFDRIGTMWSEIKYNLFNGESIPPMYSTEYNIAVFNALANSLGSLISVEMIPGLVGSFDLFVWQKGKFVVNDDAKTALKQEIIDSGFADLGVGDIQDIVFEIVLNKNKQFESLKFGMYFSNLVLMAVDQYEFGGVGDIIFELPY